VHNIAFESKKKKKDTAVLGSARSGTMQQQFFCFVDVVLTKFSTMYTGYFAFCTQN
jgi:hypothetical protein